MLKIIRKALPVVLALSMTGCATYSVQDGLGKMSLPQSSTDKTQTRYTAIISQSDEAIAAAKAEEERLAAEAQAEADRIQNQLAEEREAREKAEAEAQAAAEAAAAAEAKAREAEEARAAAEELVSQREAAEAEARAEAEAAIREKAEAEARLQEAADEQVKEAEAKAAEAAEAELQAAIERAEAEKAAREQAEADRLAAESAKAEAEAKAAEAEQARAEAERILNEISQSEAELQAAVERAAAEKAAREEAEAKAAEAQRILDEIARAEAQAQAEAEKAAEEEARAAAEAESRRLEAELSRNDYPEDLSLLTYPHIYRPARSNTVLSSTFTKVNVILIPMTDREYTEDELSRIAAAIKDIPEEFIFLTGSDRNLTELSKLLGRDSVLLEGGMIIFTPALKSANEKSAVFTLCEGKEISISVVDIYDAMAESSDLDISAWQTYLEGQSEEKIAITDEYIDSMSGTVRILALSSSEPSGKDWTIFTPYEYRDDYDWTISGYISSEGWADTYRDTHFSEETDGGITLETGSISERMDFLYTMNLMQVSSSTITLPVLSTGDVKRFATAAVYIIP